MDCSECGDKICLVDDYSDQSVTCVDDSIIQRNGVGTGRVPLM